MASVEERFQAAVNVIKGLPKNGPYQPSTTMMLKFYGLYKQATEGPCHQKKPAFWDIVGKAKWDAWCGNRHLSRQQAMQKYVEELREIIETMSYTENVQKFVGSISGLDNIDLDDLEMIVPGMKEIAESHPDSPFNSRTNSPHHDLSANNESQNANGTAKTQAESATLLNGYSDVNGHGISESTPPSLLTRPQSSSSTIVAPTPTYASVAGSSAIVDQSDDEYGDPVDLQGDLTDAILRNTELLKQIQTAVARMNSDMASVNQRMIGLEKAMQEARTVQKFRTVNFDARNRQYPSWWPFQHISPGWFVLFLLWPLILRRLSRLMLGSKKN